MKKEGINITEPHYNNLKTMKKLKAFLAKEVEIDSKYIKVVLGYFAGFVWLYSVPSIAEFSLFCSNWSQHGKDFLSWGCGAWAFSYPLLAFCFWLEQDKN
jgi:hypothetical protein